MNAVRIHVPTLVLAFPLLLTACGGGSAAVGEPFTLDRDGIVTSIESGAATGTDHDAAVTLEVTGVRPGTLTAGAWLTAVSIDTGAGTLGFTGNARIGITDELLLDGLDGTELRLVDPVSAGFDYQTYGIWNSDLGEVTGTDFTHGMVTLGDPRTPWAALDGLTGTASFTGRYLGFYTDTFVTVRVATVEGDVLLTADFTGDAPTVEFATSNSVRTYADGSTAALPADLNLVTPAPIPVTEDVGTSLFIGPLTTVGEDDPLTGTLTGTFYGPAAEESGGVFTVDNDTTGEILEGAFGATQP